MGKEEDDSKTRSMTTGYRYNYHPQDVQHVKSLDPADKRRDAYIEHRLQERYLRPPEEHGQGYPKAPKQHVYQTRPWYGGRVGYGGGEAVYGYPPYQPPSSIAVQRHDFMHGSPAMYFPPPPVPGDMDYGKASGTPAVNAKWYDKSVAALKKEKPQHAGTFSASFYQFVPLDPKDGMPERRMDIDWHDRDNKEDDGSSRRRTRTNKTYPYPHPYSYPYSYSTYEPGLPEPAIVQYSYYPPPLQYSNNIDIGATASASASAYSLGGRTPSIGSILKDDKAPPNRDGGIATTNSCVTHPPKPYGQTAYTFTTPPKQQKLEFHSKEPAVMTDDDGGPWDAERTRRRRAYLQHLHEVTDYSGKPIPAGTMKNRSPADNDILTGLVSGKKLYESKSDDEDSDC